MRPMGVDDMMAELMRLETATASKKQDEAGFEVKARTYVEILSGVPGDVARAACRSWSKREKWWPTEAELETEMRPLLAQREAIRSALRYAVRRAEQSQ